MDDDHESDEDLRAELDRLSAETAVLQAKLSRRTTIRSYLSVALVVLTSALLVASTVVVWVNRTVFDTDRFVSIVEPALDDPAFYQALSRNLSDQVIEGLDLDSRVRARLAQLDQFLAEQLVDALDVDPTRRTALAAFDRPTLSDLTPSIVDPLEGRLREVITGYVTSEEFQQRLRALVGRAHEAALAVINDELSEFPNVYIVDDEVRINLVPVVVEALRPMVDTLRAYLPDISLPAVVSDRVADSRQQLVEGLGIDLPEDFGQLTVLSPQKLSDLRDAVQRLNRAVWGLVVVTVALLVLTVASSPDRRRTLVGLAIGVTVALGFSWWIIQRVREAILDQISQADSRAAIGALLVGVRNDFRTYVLIVLALAVLVGGGAIAAAHGDSLRTAGRWLTRQLSGETTPVTDWIADHYDGLRTAGFVVAAVTLLVVGIDLWPALVIGGLLALYLLAIAAARPDTPVDGDVQRAAT